MQHKNAKVVQGSSHDVVGLTEILVLSYGQIGDNNYFYFQPARNLVKKFNIKLYKGIMMEGENVYKEGYFIYSLIENVYVRSLDWRAIEYTHKIYDAKEFRDEESAIAYCKDEGFSYFRIDKAYILEY